MKLEILLERLTHGLVEFPEYKSVGASGLDLQAAIFKSTVLNAGKRCIVPTGYRMALPGWAGTTQIESVFECQIRSRSGLAFNHGVFVLNAPGTIDNDYRGEIKVILMNLGDSPFTIKRGDRIAQLIPSFVPKVRFILMNRLPETDRAEGGFGSTGL